jgi:3-hydroxy-9,10-secoandrosta-1,3,5(10)-triene-9,17-dione monooxygenase
MSVIGSLMKLTGLSGRGMKEMPMLADLKPSADADTPAPSAEELIRRARALVPMLRERSAEVEKNRGVSPEIIRAFMDAGFFRVLQPKRWGGWEMHPEVMWRILMELGRGCCSSAWVMMVLGVHQWEFGLLPAQAGDDVWADDSTVLVGSSYAPGGEVRPVEGGYVLNGRWRASSGTDFAQWTFLGGVLKDKDGRPRDRCAFLVSRKSYEVVDDWEVLGLIGTASKSLVVRDAFVPSHRVHSIIDYRLSDRASNYLLPFFTMFGGSLSSVICGFGQQAVDIYIEQMKVRRDTNSGLATANSPYVRQRLGDAVVLVSSGRARLLQLLADTSPRLARRELITLEERVRYACEIAQVGRNVEEAVLLLFKATSARGLFLDNPIQRVLRDVVAATNHIAQNGDDAAGVLGGYLLGLDLPPLLYAPAPEDTRV